MPFVHGKSTVVKIANAADALVDLSAYITSAKLADKAGAADVTVFGATAKAFLAGLKDATFSIDGKFDATPNTQLIGILGHAVVKAVEYGPAGSTVGNPKFTFSAICTDYSLDDAVANEVTFSAQFQVSGAVTLTTY